MNRPSEQDVSDALGHLRCVVAAGGTTAERTAGSRALRVLKAATEPRPVWPAKEVGECLGVNPANLRVGRMQNFDKFPEPAQELPRPTEKDPAKTVRFWYVDEVQDFKRDYMRGGQ